MGIPNPAKSVASFGRKLKLMATMDPVIIGAIALSSTVTLKVRSSVERKFRYSSQTKNGARIKR